MHFYLIAADHKTAPLAVRENFYRKRRKIVDFWAEKDAAVLITCNRIEVYALAQDADAALADIIVFGREVPGFLESARIDHGRIEIFRHALRLAAGLESQLQGELQVFQQLAAWRSRENLPEALDELWGKALSLSRHIRSSSGLDQPAPDIVNAVFYDLAGRIGWDGVKEIVVAGTGKIAGLFSVHSGGFARINFAAHKNFSKAKELAEAARGKALLLKDLPGALFSADVLVSATSSPHFLFDKHYFDAITAKRSKPLYIYDLAVPRDVKADARESGGIVLNDLETLREVFSEHNASRRTNIILAQDMVKQAVEEFKETVYGDDIENRHAAEQISAAAGRGNTRNIPAGKF